MDDAATLEDVDLYEDLDKLFCSAHTSNECSLSYAEVSDSKLHVH